MADGLSPATAHRPAGAGGTRPRGDLVRWLVSFGTFAVPQAGGPIAFALLALPLTGTPRSGAAIVLAITLSQVVGAVPVARLGRLWNAGTYLKTLIAVRTLALVAVAGLAAVRAPFGLLLAASALAGCVTGAAFGFLRSSLNPLVGADRMPRALGLAATLNEFTFVAAPVLASLLGAVDPVAAVLALAVLGAAALVLLPPVPDTTPPPVAEASARLLTRPVLLWLGCTAANSAVVSSVEVGAVSQAVRYGLQPAQGALFTVVLCLASVAGGVWVSARNRAPALSTVLGWLVAMSAGAVLAACALPIAVTLASLLMIGGVVAPLGTAYSLRLDALAPPGRRAEVFALSRTANAVGIIVTSMGLTLVSLPVTEAIAAATVCAAAAAVALGAWRGRGTVRGL